MSSEIMKVKRAYLLESWAKQVEDYQASGLSLSKWCKLNSISSSTFSYRLKQVRMTALPMLEDTSEEVKSLAVANASPTFVEIPTSKTMNFSTEQYENKVTFSVNNISMTVENPSMDMFKVMMEAMLHAQ